MQELFLIIYISVVLMLPVLLLGAAMMFVISLISLIRK
tara:strand:- start:2108 stop:2221 length:114 start_codon:yes stop_codon:yes gene_type:complete